MNSLYKKYFGLFKSIDDLKAEFWIGDIIADEEVLLASYGYEDYTGDAFVLFCRDGKLYEVNGGHCSCYGLEGQFLPEETSKEVLLLRLENINKYHGFMYSADSEARAAFRSIVERLK